MTPAQTQVENWLTETLHRELYEGKDVRRRLQGISEALPASEQEAQNYICTWLMELDESGWPSSIKIMNRLIDLWGYISHFDKTVEESLVNS